MAEQSNKVSPKILTQKSEISNNSAKSRFLSKITSNGSKIKSEMSNSAPTTYLGKCYEDQQVKLKLLELTPRNPAKETSEGVQEFIKQVSNFIEKKNPFKDKVLNSLDEIEGNVGSVKADPIKFDMRIENSQKNQTFHILRQTTLDRNSEISGDDDRNHLENLRREKPNSAVSLKRTSDRIQQGKKNRSGISIRQKDQTDKKNQKELSPKNIKKNVEMKRVITLNENPIFLYENERRNRATHCGEKKNGNTPTNKQNQAKKKKVSEIPLRKNKKQFSTLLQKPLKNDESTFSIDLFPQKKHCSPIEELSLCSEIQVIISAIASSEKLYESGKASDCESVKKKISEENSSEQIKLNRCLKSSDITSDPSPLSVNLCDDLSFADKKVKVLDLEKVKTASFTVLRSNTTAFNRLEFLHKRNISTKEEKIAAKTRSKPRILSPKHSFSSLKEKNLKKNFSFRSSSKGNKPSLKIKGRKNKKKAEETFLLLKKRSRSRNKPSLDICKQILSTENACPVLQGFRESDNPKNENLKANQNKERKNRENDSNIPVTVRKYEGKSVLRRITGIKKGKEEQQTHLGPLKTNTEELTKYEKLETTRNSASNKKLEKASHRNGNLDGKKKELNLGLKFHKTMPRTPPPTPDIDRRVSGLEDDEKTIILNKKFNRDNDCMNGSKIKTRKKPIKTRSNIDKVECESRESVEETKETNLGLVIEGRSLNLGKDEPPEKPESSDSSKVKIQLNIDVNLRNETDNIKSPETIDWLFMNGKQCNGELIRQSTNWDDLESENMKEKKTKRDYNIIDSITSELTDEKVRNKTVDLAPRKFRKSCFPFKRRAQCKTSSINIKRLRKKKVRSDTEDKRLPPSSSYFNSDLSLQTKVKFDSKLKNDLKEESQRDLFENVTSVNLRRRNSEPHSFKGFVWKRTDFGNPKGLRPSVSSLASSLKHLNTDDIDDFIFWEPTPQKITSCWETSLYHFKKPWTVLSCSVFKDNRQSKTPGLILENLKNGGNLNIRPSAISRNESTKCHKVNLFDVEPSIAQKNIDIRNWLAALNFSTPPSASDVISEGHFSMQTIDAPNLNKIETCSKRRKVLPKIKFSEENSEKEIEGKEKYKTSTNWETNETGHLMELIRRKSGGFVTKEQFLNYDPSISRPNITVNFCVYSKSAEKQLEKTKDADATNTDPKMLESSLEAPERIISSNSLKNQSVGTDEVKKEHSETVKNEKKLFEKRRLRLKLKQLVSEAKVWKLLFMFTLIIAIVHYFFLSSSWHVLGSPNN